MTSPRALRPEQNDRIRALTKAVVDKEGGSQTAAAKALGVGRHLVTQHLLGKGAGHLLIDALRKYTGKTYDEIVDGADAPLPPEPVRERDKRYPSRSNAIAAWRKLQRDERAVERVESMGMDRDDDPDVEEWFAELVAADARIKAEDKRKAIARPELDDDYGAPKLPPRKPR